MEHQNMTITETRKRGCAGQHMVNIPHSYQNNITVRHQHDDAVKALWSF